MNPKKIVTLSNLIGVVSIFLLVYWVFIFVSMEVFGFRVFRENMTETFYLSIFGIISLMAGALIINIMFNLTRIAQKHNNDPVDVKTSRRWPVIVFILSFPVIFVLLFAGDKITSIKKEKLLVRSAKEIMEKHADLLKNVSVYSFDKEWISRVYNTLHLMSKTDSNYNTVRIIIQDDVSGAAEFLLFGGHDPVFDGKDSRLNKVDYVMKTNLEERTYLEKVFRDKKTDARFSSSDGKYELFYPVIINKRIMVFYFTDIQSYGKIGS